MSEQTGPRSSLLHLCEFSVVNSWCGCSREWIFITRSEHLFGSPDDLRRQSVGLFLFRFSASCAARGLTLPTRRKLFFKSAKRAGAECTLCADRQGAVQSRTFMGSVSKGMSLRAADRCAPRVAPGS